MIQMGVHRTKQHWQSANFTIRKVLTPEKTICRQPFEFQTIASARWTDQSVCLVSDTKIKGNLAQPKQQMQYRAYYTSFHFRQYRLLSIAPSLRYMHADKCHYPRIRVAGHTCKIHPDRCQNQTTIDGLNVFLKLKITRKSLITRYPVATRYQVESNRLFESHNRGLRHEISEVAVALGGRADAWKVNSLDCCGLEYRQSRISPLNQPKTIKIHRKYWESLNKYAFVSGVLNVNTNGVRIR